MQVVDNANSIESKELPDIEVTAEANLPTRYGRFLMTTFRTSDEGEPHVILTMGLEKDQIPVVRIHSECLTGDVFSSIKCECGDQLALALQEISRKGCGALIYLRQEGRGIGIENKLRAYALQEQGLDTVESNLELGLPIDAREYGPAAAILKFFSVERCDLMTNNPDKLNAMALYGIEVVKRRPIVIESCQECRSYIETKQTKLGHLFDE